jgi:predicted PurR-regulated permease PerM
MTPLVHERRSLLVRFWAARLLTSLLVALLIGGFVYIVGRGIGSAALLYEQQQLFGDLTNALRGGIEGLAESNLGNLREMRQTIQQRDAEYQQRSIIVGLVSAAVAAVFCYLKLEQQAISAEGDYATSNTAE